MLRTLFFLHIHYLTRALGHSRLLFSHRPYSVRTSARDSAPLSILTLGENHLNFHFEFPQDYRLGCRYFHLDATKWVLRLLNWCGLARNLKKTPFKEILKVPPLPSTPLLTHTLFFGVSRTGARADSGGAPKGEAQVA